MKLANQESNELALALLSASCHTDRPIFKNMRSWHDPKYPGVGAVLLRVEEPYSGAEQLL
jgi:hypothetical protein